MQPNHGDCIAIRRYCLTILHGTKATTSPAPDETDFSNESVLREIGRCIIKHRGTMSRYVQSAEALRNRRMLLSTKTFYKLPDDSAQRLTSWNQPLPDSGNFDMVLSAPTCLIIIIKTTFSLVIYPYTSYKTHLPFHAFAPAMHGLCSLI